MPARRFVLLIIVAASILAATRPAVALVVTGVSTIHASAPVDDPGWLNVGDRGVYLGNRWVISAFHVGAGTTVFPGVGSFAYETGTAVRLQNPAGEGLTTFTDLVLYRLTTDPGLPSLTLPSAPPAIGAEVTLIGDGRANSPGDAEKQWAVTGTFPNYVWTEVSSGGNAAGYTSNRFAKLWGTNRVEDDEPFFGEGDANHTVNVNAGFGQVISLFSVFDAPSSSNATASEAQALVGDSGSAVFAKIGAEWNLVGISHAIGVFPQQPGFENPPLVPPAPQSAVYGNLTYFADLSRYRDQILSITAIPEAGSFALVGAAMAMAGATAWGRRRTDNRRQA